MRTAIVRTVRGQQEIKYFDAVQTLTNVNTQAFSFYVLTAVPQGDTDQQRDGDRLQPISMKINVQLIAGPLTSSIRILVMRWKPNNSLLAPTSAQLFIDATGQQTILTNYYRDYRMQFRILYDKVYPMGLFLTSAGVATVVANPLQRHISINLRKLPAIQYASGGNSGTNMIYFLITTDDAATPPTFGFYSRLLYTDS